MYIFEVVSPGFDFFLSTRQEIGCE